jgi:hypothetical protein
MKSKNLLLFALASVLLFMGCKSEAEKKLDEACSKDMSVADNEKACQIALLTNCGGLLGVGAVKGCLENEEQGGCNSIPSYCIDNYSKAFGLKEKFSTKGEETYGLISSVVGKIRGAFTSEKADEINEKEVQKIISEYMSGIATYIKLQNAYVGDGSREMGSWSQIGYSAPPDREELYYKEYRQGSVKGLQVTSRMNLADCPANSSWMVRCLYVDKESRCDFSIQSKDKKACESISQSFKRMGEISSESFINTTYESFNENLSKVEKQSEIHSQKAEHFTETIQKNEQDNLIVAKDKIKDARDGKIYQIAKFNGKIWMAENLNFAAEGSLCYENNSENCEEYGRLYTWGQAMSSCPKGWHLPSETEWNAAPSGIWNTFAGYFYVAKGVFYKKNVTAYYWTSTETVSESAFDMDLNADSEVFVKKNHSKKDVAFSVRCIKD